MAISEARLAANRANARKSTGPKTPAGKARSRANALKHGLSASVIGQCEEFAPVLAGLHPPDPATVTVLLWRGATPDDRLLVVKVAALLAQQRAIEAHEARCLDQLETYCAMQQAMVLVEPETMARLGTRVDITFTLMRRGYFGWPPPAIMGRPWKPRANGGEALNGVLLAQRYARQLQRSLGPLLEELDRRRQRAVGGWGGGTQMEAEEVGLIVAACEGASHDLSHKDGPAPEVRDLAADRREPCGAAGRPCTVLAGSPEAQAIVREALVDIDTLLATRTQAPAGSGPALAPFATAGPIDPARAPGAAQPRPPPDDEHTAIVILPGVGRVAWRPGPGGYRPVGAGDWREPEAGAGATGPLAVGRLAHEPRQHGVGPHDPLWPLIPPQPTLDDRMNEVIVTVDPAGTRGREREACAEPPLGAWRRGPNGRFDRFSPGRGTYCDPWIPIVWWQVKR